MNFRNIEPNSYEEIKDFLFNQNSKICEYSFGILYIWKDYFNFKYAIYKDYLFIKEDSEDEISFLLPIGNDLIKGLNILIEYCENNNIDLILDCVPEIYKEKVNKFLKTNPIDLNIWSDYLYDAIKMSSYSGKTMSKKRTHFNNFIKKHPNYKVEIIDKNNIEEVKLFYDQLKMNNNKDYDLFKYEENNLHRVFNNYFELPFIGMLLKNDNEVIAFTIGEIVNDVLMVHIEKANREFDGSFPAIQKLFATYCLENYNIKFINREDDAGDEGLRKSKLSYKPIYLIKKYRFEYKIEK